MRARTGNAFGVLFEGDLEVPEAGDVTFSALIDNAFVLEIDGVIVLNVYGVSGGRYTAPPIQLASGRHSLRASFADWGGLASLELEASGGGFPGGLIPAGAFQQR